MAWESRPSVTLEQAVREVVSSKKLSGRRPKYISSLKKDYLTRFMNGRELCPIADISVADVETWIANFTNASTRQTWVNRLSAMFSYAVRRRYIERNPCDDIEPITIDRPTPKILTVPQFETCLRFTLAHRPRLGLWLVLAGIVGIRPEEIKRLDKKRIARDAQQGIIIIDSASSKVRQRRVIELTGHQRNWIDGVIEPSQLPVPHSTVRRFIRKLRGLFGFKGWPKDILRHTALSHALALHRDAGRVAKDAGNSERILLTHYNGLVTPEENAMFQKLMPPDAQMYFELGFNSLPQLINRQRHAEKARAEQEDNQGQGDEV